MEKTSIIKSINFKTEWNGGNGTIFYHDIEFDNGDKGSIGAKIKNPDNLSPGSEITYTLTDGKVKRVQAQNNNSGGNGSNGYSGGNKGGNRNGDPLELKIASYAMSYAKDLVSAGKVEESNLTNEADKIYSWIKTKIPA